MKNIRILCCILLLAGRSVSAQEKDAGVKDTIIRLLHEVVVTAQRNNQQNIDVPFSVAVLNRPGMDEFNPRTTPDALMLMNGVFVQKTNQGGGSAIVRGLTGNQLLLVIDGIRMNNSTYRYGPNQYLNNIDPYTIQKIEVARGSGSVQYGSDGLGGVIQVFTREPGFSEKRKVWEGRLSGKFLTGGMERTARGEIGYGGKKFAAQAGVTYRDFGDLVGGDTTGKQSPSGYNELAADLKFRFLLKPGWEIIAACQLVTQKDVPVYHKIILENFMVNEMDLQERVLNYAKLKGDLSGAFIKQVELTASWQRSTEQRSSRKNGSTLLRKERDEINTLGLSADIYTATNKWWTANTGVEIYLDKVNSNRTDISQVNSTAKELRGLYPDDSGFRSYSLYSLQHFSFRRFVAELGFRYNRFGILVTDSSLGKVNLTPAALVGNSALLYRINDRHSIFTSVSSGYRAPNIDDMGTLGIVDFRYEIPSGDLEPERSVHAEAGYKFALKRISGSFSVYHLQLRNIITRVKVDGQLINGYQVYRKENIEKAVIRGIEAELKWQLSGELSVYSSAAYAHGQNLTRNEPMRRIPPFNARITGTWRKKDLFLAVDFQAASKQQRLAQGDKDDNRIPAGGTPGWALLNFYCGYHWKALQWNAGLQNIFNMDYRTHGSGINGMGRSMVLSFTINL